MHKRRFGGDNNGKRCQFLVSLSKQSGITPEFGEPSDPRQPQKVGSSDALPPVPVISFQRDVANVLMIRPFQFFDFRLAIQCFIKLNDFSTFCTFLRHNTESVEIRSTEDQFQHGLYWSIDTSPKAHLNSS
jgi:hypothetical protein